MFQLIATILLHKNSYSKSQIESEQFIPQQNTCWSINTLQAHKEKNHHSSYRWINNTLDIKPNASDIIQSDVCCIKKWRKKFIPLSRIGTCKIQLLRLGHAKYSYCSCWVCYESTILLQLTHMHVTIFFLYPLNVYNRSSS